jgi:hypothetical protein
MKKYKPKGELYQTRLKGEKDRYDVSHMDKMICTFVLTYDEME